MPKKRKNDFDEIRQLKEKIRKLEHNRSRERYRRIRVLLSSSESSAPQSPTPPSSRHGSQQRCCSPAASRSPTPTAMDCSQDARSGAETEPDRRATSSSRQHVVVLSPKNPQVISIQAQVHAPPTTKPRELLPHAQRPALSTNKPTQLPDDYIEHANDVNAVVTDADNVDAIEEPELSSNILEILGDDPSVPKIYGKDIQKDIAIRFNHIATNGLSKEMRKEIRDKYPIPANCTLIDAPQINPEIKAAISETTSKRLGGMEQKQKQLACAISCLGEAITLLISQNDTDPHLLRLLMDAGRIICDTQYTDSLTRRFLVLASLKKEMKDQLLLTKIDSFLFGKNFSETLKSAKAITKSGAELKQSDATIKQPHWKSNNNKNRPVFKKNNLNTKTPPSSHRSTGNARPRTPAPKNQPVSSSRSSRPTYKRGHR